MCYGVLLRNYQLVLAFKAYYCGYEQTGMCCVTQGREDKNTISQDSGEVGTSIVVLLQIHYCIYLPKVIIIIIIIKYICKALDRSATKALKVSRWCRTGTLSVVFGKHPVTVLEIAKVIEIELALTKLLQKKIKGCNVQVRSSVVARVVSEHCTCSLITLTFDLLTSRPS